MERLEKLEEVLQDVYVYGLDEEGTPINRSSFPREGEEPLAYFQLPSKIGVQLHKYRLNTDTRQLELKEDEELETMVETDLGLVEESKVQETMEVNPTYEYLDV